MGLAFWYGGKLLFQGEYNATDFFVIFVAIIFGGQAAGFLFGFTLSRYLLPNVEYKLSDSTRHHQSPRGCKSYSLLA